MFASKIIFIKRKFFMKLSLLKYAGLCVVGGEAAYLMCYVYGFFLNGKLAELHHALLALLPGFTWGNIGGLLLGAISIALWSGLGGLYIAWMHNVSIMKR